MRKLAVALCLALVAMMVPAASASHPTQLCLDIHPDEHYPVSNDDIVDVMWAYPGATDAGHPPERQGCVTQQEDPGHDATGTNVDWEIVGAGDPDSSDTPKTPDRTCTVPEGAGHCTVMAAESAGGNQTIRAWIDVDLDDATIDGTDLTEGSNEDSEPGSFGEADITDVALWTWDHGDPPPPPCGNDRVCTRRITIDYRKMNGTFFGRVRGEDEVCQTSRVTVKKARSGPDKTIFETGTSNGTWRARTNDSHRGRFYAVLGKSFAPIPNAEPPAANECSRDRSPTIELKG